MKKLKHLHPIKRWNSWDSLRKTTVSAVLIVLVVGGALGFARVQDWRNKQFLESIAADFTRLQTDLERELGVSVENKSGCFTTSEKFNEGKTACFFNLSVYGSGDLRVLFEKKIVEIGAFGEIEKTNDRFYEIDYLSWPCNAGFNKTNNYSSFGFECPVPVRGGNADFVRELF